MNFFLLFISILAYLFPICIAQDPIPVNQIANMSWTGLDPQGSFGSLVKGVGDINGDYIDDILIGAPSTTQSGNFTGSLYVLFGSQPNGPYSGPLSSLTGSNGFKIESNLQNDHFGLSASGFGDINNDGFTDFVVGSHFGDATRTYSGHCLVVFGRTSWSPSYSIDTVPFATRIFGRAEFDFLCTSVDSSMDFNQDGYADILVGAYNYRSNTSSYDSGAIGAVYLFDGAKFPTYGSIDLASWNPSYGIRIFGEDSHNHIGYQVKFISDFNKDGNIDILISAPFASYKEQLGGSLYYIFGPIISDGFSVGSLDGTNGFRVDGTELGNRIGLSIDGGSDFNLDGYSDTIIGSIEYSSVSDRGGFAIVLYGFKGPYDPVYNILDSDTLPSSIVYGSRPFASIGDSVAMIPHPSNSSRPADIVTGAPLYPFSNYASNIGVGRFFYVYGSSEWYWNAIYDHHCDDFNDVGYSLVGNSSQIYSQFGDSVAYAGDVNNDGISDILIGASNGPSIVNPYGGLGSAFLIMPTK